MKTLTVRLPDVLVSEIEHQSRTRRVSKSDIVRERLSQPQSGVINSGGMLDLIGDILQESWTAKVGSGTPSFRSSKKENLARLIRGKKLHHR